MRYSMLVHLTKMARTLQEAAEYIDIAPDGDQLCPELLSNGEKMLEQIRAAIEQHRNDLHDPVLLEHLAAAEALWEVGGDTLQGALEAFALALPESVHYQVRAVFFTGLGSTWDAMQSVYEYMREDSRFDPVVVLIPVFRQVKQDGEIKSDVIYQDYLTPLGVPFYAYTQYHIENDLPDLAFINQPYENVVLEQYWPKNIARYTRLVYLPYYLPDILHKGSIEALCLLPVYKYAWKVVCASEKHLAFYCKHSMNRGGNVLLTGLPKMDHLVGLQEQGVPQPAGWENMQGKTVFLWNSWFDMNASSLKYADALISWFEIHQECYLIWRPHPMTDTVTKLYYPEQYESYQLTRQKIQHMPNAVVDTETSYEAAFFYSDAQIADYSSLLPQYLPLDKPALWIKSGDWEITGVELIESIWMEKTVSVDGIYSFLNRIQKGEDINADLRRKIRKRDLVLADGHSGRRVCEAVWQLMHTEDQILSF